MVGSARTTLLLSKIVPAYAGAPERYFRSKERCDGFGTDPCFEGGARFATQSGIRGKQKLAATSTATATSASATPTAATKEIIKPDPAP